MSQEAKRALSPAPTLGSQSFRLAVYIVGSARTAMGEFNGPLASFSAPKLGSIVIEEALKRAGVDASQVEEVFLGNVLSANLGQAPARQAALGAKLPVSVPCTTVNKVCASGMKAVMFGAQSIMLEQTSVVVAGGFENMSRVPYYADTVRFGSRMGDSKLVDGLIKDGLWDVYNQFHMGSAAEMCATSMKFSRKDQDEYATRSYQRALQAYKDGHFAREIVPVPLSAAKKGQPKAFAQDSECFKSDFSKLGNLKPAFISKEKLAKGEGTVTAGNASVISDGASALVLASANAVKKLGLQDKQLFRIVSFADAAQSPELFTTAPVPAIRKALQQAGLSVGDIDYFEINEAFSVVALANIKLLGLDPERVNVFGGAVSLGHPLGSSGARIIVTLCNVLQTKGGRFGCAAICNGGGGASAIVIERVDAAAVSPKPAL